MEISLKNYKTVLSKELLIHAEKNSVRECDEVEKGHFVAYVDEGDESFDVALTFSSGSELTAHNCDCKNGKSFCRHQAALLAHIAENKKTKQTIKGKKTGKSDALLDEADLIELKAWVKDLFAKNKDIELAFVNYFSAKKHEYTPGEVMQVTNEAIKAVVKNKKMIDATQLKKVIDLWTEIHAPIVQSYLSNMADENSFLNFHTITESCNNFLLKLNVSSNKIRKYIEGLLEQSAEYLNNIYDDEIWTKATGYFIKFIRQDNGIRMHYLMHLKNLVSVSNEARTQKLVDLLAEQYRKTNPDAIHGGSAYSKIIFEIVENFGLSKKYCHIFKPIRYDNDYNKKLIESLVKNMRLELAEKYCRQQVAYNAREEYNIPYLKLLKEIYKVKKDESKLADVLENLFPYTFQFEDYMFIYSRINDDEEKKKWRTKILSKARSASRNYNISAIEFSFKLMDSEKRYLKMIEYINSYTPYRIIDEYFEPMANADKTRLLKAIIDRDQHYSWSYGINELEKDKKCFPSLFASVLKYFSAAYLKSVIKKAESQRMYYSKNYFLEFMKKELETAADT
jgi:hypothetical protein